MVYKGEEELYFSKAVNFLAQLFPFGRGIWLLFIMCIHEHSTHSQNKKIKCVKHTHDIRGSIQSMTNLIAHC